jgi:hypothetical protein
MTRLSHDVRAQAVGLALITLATGAAFWVGEGLEGALPPFLILLAFSVFVLVGRTRSDAVRAMSGVGDERTRSLYERSVAFAGTVVSFAVPTWWLVTVARASRTTRSPPSPRSSARRSSSGRSCCRAGPEPHQPAPDPSSGA